MFEEIVQLLENAPPWLLVGVKSLIETLTSRGSEEERRIALDRALAAAEDELVRKEFPE